jgi:hypothetical protein
VFLLDDFGRPGYESRLVCGRLGLAFYCQCRTADGRIDSSRAHLSSARGRQAEGPMRAIPAQRRSIEGAAPLGSCAFSIGYPA